MILPSELRLEDLEQASFVNSPEILNDPIQGIAIRDGQPALSAQLLSLFIAVRNMNREMFLSVDGSALSHMLIKEWKKSGPSGEPQGGGLMSILRGPVLEKAAVNMSVVWGSKYPALEGEHAGKPFLAAGVSLICHPLNPNAPIAHMNIRCLVVGEGSSRVTWVGGGADLTPMVPFEDDTREFHAAMETACRKHRLGDYPRFKKWCDEYFFIPHRGETRGVGGIFFDYLTVESPDDFGLLLEVGQNFAKVYGDILRRRVGQSYEPDLKEKHLYWRGRYAEFNLAYDRGTRFGLLSGGNTEAIFASLPPVVKW